jgi:hypothetical protein
VTVRAGSNRRCHRAIGRPEGLEPGRAAIQERTKLVEISDARQFRHVTLPFGTWRAPFDTRYSRGMRYPLTSLLVTAGLVLSAADAVESSKCSSVRFVEAGKRISAVATCWATVIQRGVIPDNACLARADRRFDSHWANAVRKGDRPADVRGRMTRRPAAPGIDPGAGHWGSRWQARA